MVKKGEKATATLFYLFATALYFKKRERRWQSTHTQVSVMGFLPVIEYENSQCSYYVDVNCVLANQN
jgi:hypothetical protein